MNAKNADLLFILHDVNEAMCELEDFRKRTHKERRQTLISILHKLGKAKAALIKECYGDEPA